MLSRGIRDMDEEFLHMQSVINRYCGWIVRRTPGMAPKANKRNVLVLLIYLLFGSVLLGLLL